MAREVNSLTCGFSRETYRARYERLRAKALRVSPGDPMGFVECGDVVLVLPGPYPGERREKLWLMKSPSTGVRVYKSRGDGALRLVKF